MNVGNTSVALVAVVMLFVSVSASAIEVTFATRPHQMTLDFVRSQKTFDGKREILQEEIANASIAGTIRKLYLHQVALNNSFMYTQPMRKGFIGTLDEPSIAGTLSVFTLAAVKRLQDYVNTLQSGTLSAGASFRSRGEEAKQALADVMQNIDADAVQTQTFT